MMCGPELSIFIHIGSAALCELTVDGAKHFARYFIAGFYVFVRINKYFMNHFIQKMFFFCMVPTFDVLTKLFWQRGNSFKGNNNCSQSFQLSWVPATTFQVHWAITYVVRRLLLTVSGHQFCVLRGHRLYGMRQTCFVQTHLSWAPFWSTSIFVCGAVSIVLRPRSVNLRSGA